tara:strand:+ start:389 stop:592 length:204 start_codon:yes stop_codon:yes gene_type:complete
VLGGPVCTIIPGCGETGRFAVPTKITAIIMTIARMPIAVGLATFIGHKQMMGRMRGIMAGDGGHVGV